MVISFGGVSTVKDDKRVEDHFALLWDNDYSAVYLGKKEFVHEEEDLNFKYRYGIIVTDMEKMTGDDNIDLSIAVELLLVVSPDSMVEKELKRLQEDMGVDQYMEEDTMFGDLIEAGYGVRFGIDYVENDPDEELHKIGGVVEKVEAIAQVYEAMDSMRGFTLDKPWNKVGTNGWDSIKHIVYGEPLFG